MNGLIESLYKLSPLTEDAVIDLSSAIETKSSNKGDFILKAGRVCSRLYYLNEGLVKLYYHTDGSEFIMRFFAANSIFTGLDSYLTQERSGYSIITLEPSIVSYVAHADVERCSRKHHCVETAMRKFLSIASVNMMKRISEMLNEDATARYNNFVSANGELMQRISLGDLACYLGISQVSLSRIRAKK